MSLLVKSPVASRISQLDEYEVVVLEKCEYLWDFNSVSYSPHKESPVFSAKDPMYTWYLKLNGKDENSIDVELVLNSSISGDGITANCRFQLTNPKISVIHRTITETGTFYLGRRSLSVRLRRLIYERQVMSELNVFVQVAAEVDRKKCIPENVIYPDFHLQHFKSMMKNKTHSDIIVKTKSEEIAAHRSVLACRSPVFAAMLSTDMLEKNTGIVEITDFDSAAVKEMITFLYTGSLPNVGYEAALELLKISDKYDISDLKVVCESYLCPLIKKINAAELLLVAHRCNSARLKDEVVEYIQENIELFRDTKPYEELARQLPAAVNEILMTLSCRLKGKPAQ